MCKSSAPAAKAEDRVIQGMYIIILTKPAIYEVINKLIHNSSYSLLRTSVIVSFFFDGFSDTINFIVENSKSIMQFDNDNGWGGMSCQNDFYP